MAPLHENYLMFHAFSISLEAVDPALGRFRAYRLEAGTDLFGAWLVDMTYGRIGTRGTSRRYVADDEAGARKIVRHHLRRRTTAKKRIGVSYRVREVTDTEQWVRLEKGVELVSAASVAERLPEQAEVLTVRMSGTCEKPQGNQPARLRTIAKVTAIQATGRITPSKQALPPSLLSL